MDRYIQWKIQEMKEQKMIEQHGMCAGCEQPFKIGETRELAHIVPKRKDILASYGSEIINHRLNMKLTHTGWCNSHVQMNVNAVMLVAEHIKMIQEAIENE